jgi:hypothetical protein
MMFMGVTHHTQKFQEPVTPKLITWCHIGYAEMLLKVRTKGKGQVDIAEIPTLLHPSQPITGGHRQNAEMPLCYRPHQFYLVPSRLCRNANLEARHWGEPTTEHRNVRLTSLSSTNHMGPSSRRSNASGYTPHRIWAIIVPQQCQKVGAQITPTRGHPLYAEMPTPLHLWSLKQGERNGQKIRR